MTSEGEKSGFFQDLKFILSNKIKARYYGWHGFSNLGDDVIYHATREAFAKDVLFYAAEEDGPLAELLGRRLNFRAIFLGGGTLIKGPSAYLRQLRKVLPIFTKAKFIIFGTGVGDVEMWKSFGVKTDTERWRDIVERSDYIGVRGPLSKKHLIEWGVKKEIRVIGDTAVWFAREKVAPKEKTKRIGINLGSTYKEQIHGRNENAVLEFGASLMKRLAQEGWQISLFPMVQEDVEYMNRAVKMAGISDLEMHKNFLDFRYVMKEMEKQDIFIGEKLHSVVLASCVYTPAIMLEYRTKCKDFMMSIGREDWNYRTDNLNLGTIFDRLTELYENLETHQNRIAAQIKKIKAGLETAVSEINSIIRKT